MISQGKGAILFINQSSGYLMLDIILVFQDHYDKISLVTGDLNLRNKKLPEHVKVSRIIAPKRNNSIQRFFTWTLGFIQIFWKLLWISSKVDLFIVSNPPLVTFLPLFFGNKFTILLFDIYPDALHEHNLFGEKSFVVRWWASINRRIFNRAEKIFTLTEGMKMRAAQYVDEAKISVVPIWTDNDFFTSIPMSENIFVRQYQLEDRFIVMYSGNLGYTHNIEILVDLACAVEEDDIQVLIIGDGAKRNMIKEKIEKLGVRNCMLLPWQQVEMIPYSFSAANIGVVSLGANASTLSLPSKIFNLMSVGVPILSIAHADSELSRIVGKYEMGECFADSDLEGMIAYVKDLHSNRSRYNRLSNNSKNASLDFSPENAKKFVI